MSNEKTYTISLKYSEICELQLALLYHIDNVLIPYYEETAKHSDYIPTQAIKARIDKLQRILEYLNMIVGPCDKDCL